MTGLLVVFAKAPRPGEVKTRMVPPLTAEQAASLYACMLDDVLEHMAGLAPALGLGTWLAVHPPDACAELARRAPPGFAVVAQRGSSLAQRMTWAVAEGAASGRSPVLLRGSDSPTLGEATLRAALEALGRADLVVSPDPDGGYNLVGLRRPVAGLFEHDMSTDSVLEETLRRAEAHGLRAERLAPGFDIDTAADLQRLAEARLREARPLCPRTLAFLDAEKLW